MKKIKCDYLVIGAGIIGLTLVYNLKKKKSHIKVIIIDKEQDIGKHASGRNSGVLHAGFYYLPDSLKAKFTKEGNKILSKYCEEKGISIKKCGKVVVTKSEKELETLFELKRRGEINGVELYIVDNKELLEIEPNAKTVNYALWSPNTSVVNPLEVLNNLKEDLKSEGVHFLFNTPYKERLDQNAILAGENVIEYNSLINCAGLYADKIAKDFGYGYQYTILPFKGLYLKYVGPPFIKTNIYPVPNLRNPFLGVHFTIDPFDRIKIGPTAIPCFWREQYQFFSNFNLLEFLEISFNNLKLFLKNNGIRDLAKEEFKKYLKRYMIYEGSKLVKYMDFRNFKEFSTSGIRAQLLNLKTLELVYDFVIEGNSTSLHILNAVSPAFTASFPFTSYVIENYLS